MLCTLFGRRAKQRPRRCWTSAGPEPGGPQHTERDAVSGRVGPVGTGGGRPPSRQRWWRGRPGACAGGPGCGCGRQARCVCSSSGAQNHVPAGPDPGLGIADQVVPSSSRTARRPVRRASLTLCPRARQASKTPRPAPADPASRSPPCGPRAIPFGRSDHARLFRLPPCPQPYSPSNSATERGDNIRPMPAIGQLRRSVGSFWSHRR
jgi:hypothetical protein